ncbi:MAG: hypothetical protein R3A79_20845 [Nannocystaceae bacterium]
MHDEPSADAPPHGCTWGRYVALLIDAHGGAAALVDRLIRRADEAVGLPEDPQSIERGLRRLATRGNAPGGQYGRWLLRFFGVPSALVETARWMGQYHGRFADLPAPLCESQLWLWDRPPIAESRATAWIHLGLAAVAMRRRDRDAAAHRLRLAQAGAAAAGPEAEVEAALLAARIASDAARRDEVGAWLDRAAAQLAAIESDEARAPYTARVLDQRAYALLHPEGAAAPALAEARALYAAIPEVGAPFVRFRRAHGLAYCAWRMGDTAAALTLARDACTHAGDGGLIRFRIMALDLLAHIDPTPAGDEARRRARSLAATIAHEDLL